MLATISIIYLSYLYQSFPPHCICEHVLNNYSFIWLAFFCFVFKDGCLIYLRLALNSLSLCSHSGSELLILPCLLPRCWCYRCLPPHLVLCVTGDETHAFVKVGEHFTESHLQPVFADCLYLHTAQWLIRRSKCTQRSSSFSSDTRSHSNPQVFWLNIAFSTMTNKHTGICVLQELLTTWLT